MDAASHVSRLGTGMRRRDVLIPECFSKEERYQYCSCVVCSSSCSRTRATLRNGCSGRGILHYSSSRGIIVINNDGGEIGSKTHKPVLSRASISLSLAVFDGAETYEKLLFVDVGKSLL